MENGPGTYCLCAMSFYLFHTKAHGCTTAITIIINTRLFLLTHNYDTTSIRQIHGKKTRLQQVKLQLLHSTDLVLSHALCDIPYAYAMCIYDIHATLLMTTQNNTYISANLSLGIQKASTVDPASSVGARNCTLSRLTHTPNCSAHRFYKGVIYKDIVTLTKLENGNALELCKLQCLEKTSR